MPENKPRGPARGNLNFMKYQSGNMLMSPQCHPDSMFKLFFVPADSQLGHMELRCGYCGGLYAAVRLGRSRGEE